jgi:hypothetical protein
MGYAMDEWIVAWNPALADSADPPPWPIAGQVEVGPNVRDGWAVPYNFSSGSCYSDRREMTAEGKALMMMIDFHKVVVRDGIDPQAAHQQFLKIDEYRRMMDDNQICAPSRPEGVICKTTA